jgi:hypothetical protein
MVKALGRLKAEFEYKSPSQHLGHFSFNMGYNFKLFFKI